MTLKKAIKIFKIDFYRLKGYLEQGAPHTINKNGYYEIDPIKLATWFDENTEVSKC